MNSRTLIKISLATIAIVAITGCGGGGDSGGGGASGGATTYKYDLDKFLYTTYDGFDNTKQEFETTENYTNRMNLKLQNVKNTTLNLYGDAFHEDFLRYKSFQYNADTKVGTIFIRFSYRDSSVPSFNSTPTFYGISYEILKTNASSSETSENPYILTPIASDYGKVTSTHSYVFDNLYSAADVALSDVSSGSCEGTSTSISCTLNFTAEPDEAEKYVIAAKMDIEINDLTREREWNYVTYSGVKNYTYEWFYPAKFKKLTIYDKTTNKVFGTIQKN
jgi:hypothetical protein